MLENFIQKATIIHNNKYGYSLVLYKNVHTKVSIECPSHGIFEQTPKNHINSSGCPKCAYEFKAKKQSKSNEQFIKELYHVHGDKYEYSNVNYINNKTNIQIHCKEHNFIFEIRPSHILRGHGCSKCSKNYKITTSEFVEKCNKIHNYKYDYSNVSYINNSTKVEIICPNHGNFIQQPLHHLNGVECPKCKTSKGENKVRMYLLSKNIKFEEQKTFNNLLSNKGTKLKFDFYLNEENICIEYDGVQHFSSLSIFGGEEEYIKRKYHDNLKDEYCKNNNIRLLRISYTDYNNIESILKQITNKN